MSNIVDLSHEIVHQMPVFPGDPPVGILSHHKYAQIGYCVTQVVMGTHTGTHVDAPKHKFSKGETVDNIPLEKFIGKALVIDLTHLKLNQEITLADINQFKEDIKLCNIILFKTGWSERFGKSNYFTSFPGIEEETARWISNKDINLIGLESPSVHPTEHEKIHEYFLENNIVVLENLNNLKRLTPKYVMFYAVPLKLKGLDGSPVRAFAIEE